MLDESKTVVATRQYNAFGEIVSESGAWPSEVPFGYQSNWLYLPGMTLADGSPLYLSPTRVYHAGLGRFLQRDPKRTPGENLYVYARNNPVNMVDPMGLETCLPDFEDMEDEEVAEYLENQLKALGEAQESTQDFHDAFVRADAAHGVLRSRGKGVNVHAPGFGRENKLLRKGVARFVKRGKEYLRFAMRLERYVQEQRESETVLGGEFAGKVHEGAGTILDVLDKFKIGPEGPKNVVGAVLKAVEMARDITQAIEASQKAHALADLARDASELGFELEISAERVLRREPGGEGGVIAWDYSAKFVAAENVSARLAAKRSVLRSLGEKYRDVTAYMEKLAWFESKAPSELRKRALQRAIAFYEREESELEPLQ